jgi:Ca2+-binding RTX toxin-like protein
VSDGDGDPNRFVRVALTLRVGGGVGTLELGSTAGLLYANRDVPTMTFAGPLAAVNAALATLEYRPPLDTAADGSLDVKVTELVGGGPVFNLGLTASASVPLLPAQGGHSLHADPGLPGKSSLVVHGTAAGDVINVRPLGASASTYVVTVNGGPAVTVAGVTGRVLAFGFGGNDRLLLGAVRRVSLLDGGPGNDALVGGQFGDRLLGGDGDDVLNGAPGNDRLTGGLGNDTLEGGAGVDRLVESGDVNFTLVGGTPRRNGRLVGLGADVLVRNRVEQADLAGGFGANTIDARAFAGRVWLDGSAGNDVLRAGRGTSVLLGGIGDDHLWGGAGRDLLIGGSGADLLVGNGNSDILIGGTTTHDHNRAALDALMAAWASRAAYTRRVGQLLGTVPGGANGGYRLNATTVRGDGKANVLAGSSQADWFFTRGADILLDRHTGGAEIVTLANSPPRGPGTGPITSPGGPRSGPGRGGGSVNRP